MKILDILTKPLVSKEARSLVGFIIATGLWAFMLYIILKSGDFGELGDVLTIAAIQVWMIISYADYRASKVKKELLKEQEEIRFTLKAMQQAKNV